MYDDTPERLSGNKSLDNAGKPIPRRSSCPTPCHMCPKMPAGVEARRKNAIELSERNLAAFAHYRESRAVGGFTAAEQADRLVRRHAVLIREAFDELERVPLSQLAVALVSFRGVK